MCAVLVKWDQMIAAIFLHWPALECNGLPTTARRMLLRST